MKVLILRPQPGAGETAERARALGLEPVVTPLFSVRALDWTPPDPGNFDAVMLTSASAARQASDGLTPFKALPCYAVGEATAAAAEEAGFTNIRVGPDDGKALLLMMAVENAPAIAQAVLAAGRDPATPVAVVCDGSMPGERTVLTTLTDLGADLDRPAVRPPAIIVVGDVVAVAHPDVFGGRGASEASVSRPWQR